MPVKENHKLAVTDKVGDRAKFSSGPQSAQELAGSQVGLQERLQQRPPSRLCRSAGRTQHWTSAAASSTARSSNAREFEIQYAGDAGAQHQHIRRDEVVVKQLEVLQLPIDTWNARVHLDEEVTVRCNSCRSCVSSPRLSGAEAPGSCAPPGATNVLGSTSATARARHPGARASHRELARQPVASDPERPPRLSALDSVAALGVPGARPYGAAVPHSKMPVVAESIRKDTWPVISWIGGDTRLRGLSHTSDVPPPD